jgi:cell division initiation protein
MRLTPLDIREQQFKRVMRGLDVEEVAGFLDTVAREFEALVAENQDLRVQMQQAHEKLDDYTRMEKALRDTLIGAERIVTESRDTARKQADLVLREAELTAQQATARIIGQIAAMRQELLELRKARDAYASRLRWLLQSHLDSVNSLESNFADLDGRMFGPPGDAEVLATAPVPTAPAPMGPTAPDMQRSAGVPGLAAADRGAGPRDAPAPPRVAAPPAPAGRPVSPPPPASPAAGPNPAAASRPRAFPESHLEMWPPAGSRPAYDAGAPQPGPSPDRVRREPARPPAKPVEGLAPSNWSMERFREELME